MLSAWPKSLLGHYLAMVSAHSDIRCASVESLYDAEGRHMVQAWAERLPAELLARSRRSTSILLELPIPIIERTDLSCFQPA
jgi:hypothetical protein